MKNSDKLIFKFLWKNTGPKIAKSKMCTFGTREGKGRTLSTRYANVV